MKMTLLGALCASTSLGACASLKVEEAYLSTNQRVAVVSSRGDGVTPPATVILIEDEPGKFSTMKPIATGFGQAPVTAVAAGMGAATIQAVGYYQGQKARRPNSVTVTQGGQLQTQEQQ